MFDNEELLEILECIYEFNTDPTINDILAELCLSKSKIMHYLDVLYLYKIIEMDGNYIHLLKDYEEAYFVASTANLSY
jgi:hypothetical protein